jgi:predicted O-linked N-acetylglucosamine transferase (SPINDLY family)
LVQKPFAHEETREMFWQRLEGLGIPRDRVDLTCSTPHWQAYQDIDITLDCWPQNNGTTTLESLWMGVPVLSKMDRPSVGRWGAAALTPLGFGDWLVPDEGSFIEKAVAAASDLNGLATLRKQLRSRLESSALLDGASFTHNLENAYQRMIMSAGVNEQ